MQMEVSVSTASESESRKFTTGHGMASASRCLRRDKYRKLPTFLMLLDLKNGDTEVIATWNKHIDSE